MAYSMQSELLGPLLRNVSRSFYLTLRVLPIEVRSQIGLAYLLARAADSIADTEILEPSIRLEKLLEFRNLLQQKEDFFIKAMVQSLSEKKNLALSGKLSLVAEQKLLDHLPQCFALLRSFSNKDQKQIVEVVAQLTKGMELDLQRFSGKQTITALETFEELEEYTCHVAGCVGPFWTEMCIAHIPIFHNRDMDQMCKLGIRFGKALQWTNILRDLPRDLANGRCYLPAQELKKIGLASSDLQNPSVYTTLVPLYQSYLDHVLEHYQAGWEYIMAIPKSCSRLRLACIWPLWIGLETVALLRHAKNPLQATPRIRISRDRVYLIILRSFLSVTSDRMLHSHQTTLMQMASRRT